MKRCFLCLILLILLFTSCTMQLTETLSQSDHLPQQEEHEALQTQSEESAEKTSIEKQLDSFVEHVDDWLVDEERDWWGYAITDLNQDGRLEIIASENHGTGHYKTTTIYEIGSNYELHQISKGMSINTEMLENLAEYGGPQFTLPLITPNLYNSGVVQKYPAYYDTKEENYFYTFEDTVRDSVLGDFTTLREFSLDEHVHGIFLGYKKVAYHRDENYTSVDCWDIAGNYISSKAYDSIVDQRYSTFDKMNMYILWIEGIHPKDMHKDDLYILLAQSIESFAIKEQTTVNP